MEQKPPSDVDGVTDDVRRRYDDEVDELGGDPVCWLQFVCPRCGSMVEGVDHDLTCRAR